MLNEQSNYYIIKESLNVKDDNMQDYRLPNDYYNQKILNEIRYLILEGAKNYTSLSDTEKETLCEICMDIMKEDVFECIFNEPVEINKLMHHIMKYMKTGQNDYAIDLAENIQYNIIRFFETPLNMLFSEVQNDMLQEEMFDLGMTAEYSEEGETQWVRQWAA